IAPYPTVVTSAYSARTSSWRRTRASCSILENEIESIRGRASIRSGSSFSQSGSPVPSRRITIQDAIMICWRGACRGAFASRHVVRNSLEENPMQGEQRPYQMCVRTVMDTTGPDIWFDSDRVSSHALNYDENMAPIVEAALAGRRQE